MILASAIKFHIESTDKDVVLCGCRHGDIFQQLELLGFEPRKGYVEIEQGFINHKGEFLTRSEAYYHVKECGQLSNKILREKERLDRFSELISEDLW